MKAFSLSQLQYTYPDLINPEYSAMEEYAARVIDEYTELEPDLIKKFKKAGMGELIARFFPYAPPKKLETIIRYLVFTFVIEDTYSRLPYDELQVKCERLAVFLEDGIVLPDDVMAIRQLKCCLNEAKALNATPSWLRRFARHNNEFIQSILTETTYYKDSKPIRYPSIPECLRYREDQVAAYPFIDYVELIQGFVLPEAIAEHPYIQRLWKLITHFVIYVNDLYSIEKDIYNEEIMNIVLVMQHQEQATMEEMQIKSLHLHNELLAEFVDLCTAIPDFHPYNEPVEIYIRRLELFVQGNLSWHKTSRRYFEYQ